MPRDPNCIFCKIVAAEVPSSVAYEDNEILAFLDVGPLAEGHLLVIPRQHHTKLRDLPASLASTVASVLPRLTRALLDVSGASGVNVLCNDGAAAGQVVPHVHFHLIPRNEGDGLGYRWNAGKYASGQADALAESMQRALSRHDAH